MPKILNVLDKVSELCRLRGFFVRKTTLFPGNHVANDIYDYGPLGVELKRNVINEWWHEIVTSQENIHGVDLSVLNEQIRNGAMAKESKSNNTSFALGNYLIETCGHALNYMEEYGFQMPFGLAQNIKIQSEHTESCETDQLIFRYMYKL